MQFTAPYFVARLEKLILEGTRSEQILTEKKPISGDMIHTFQNLIS